MKRMLCVSMKVSSLFHFHNPNHVFRNHVFQYHLKEGRRRRKKIMMMMNVDINKADNNNHP